MELRIYLCNYVFFLNSKILHLTFYLSLSFLSFSNTLISFLSFSLLSTILPNVFSSHFQPILSDEMETSSDDDIQSVHTSLSENVVKEVFMQRLDLYQYNYEEGYILVDRVKYPNFLLSDVRTRHCVEMSESMHKQGYDYSLGMRVLLYPADFNPAGTTAGRMFTSEDGRRILKDGYFQIIFHGSHCQAALTFCVRWENIPWLLPISAQTLSCVEMEPASNKPRQ